MNKALLELAEIHYGKSPKGIRVDSSEYPIFGTGGQVGYAVKPLFKAPGIVVGRKGTLGNPIFSPDDFWAIDTTYAVLPKSAVEAKWIYYNLLNYDLTKLNEATGVPSINRDYLYKITFCYFELEEQRKIAEVLTTVDDAIEQTEALIRKYQRIKQGLMQDLLDNPSWPTYKLGDPELFSLYTGGTPSTEISEYWGGSIPWLSSGEVHKKRIWDTEKKITELGYKKSNARYIPVHSTLIALAGQGRTRGTAAITEIEITTNQSIAAIMPNEAKIDPYFLFHSLDYQYLRLRAASAGAGRAGLNLHLLAQFEIKVPNLISEQRRIAEYFETLDNTMHENLILKEKLVQLKQGLMQDLLTGKVRVDALLEQ